MTPRTFAEALEHVAALAQTKLPETLQGRLADALTLVQAGHVWLDEDGHTASVHSRSQGNVWHTVNGTCSCADAHYQAPSANCYITLEGRQVQVTLRDADETRLLMRLAAVLKQYPTTQPDTAQSEGWCKKHGVAMKLNHKDGRTWWSHKTDQGWCKGKGVRHG